MLSNREIATLVWCVPLVIWALSKTGTRTSLAGVLRAVTKPCILVTIAVMTAYVSGVVYCLAQLGIWNTGMVKDTVLWLCLSALGLLLRFVGSRKDENIFKEIFFDSVKVIIILEFLIGTYTFGLVAELFFVPFVTLVALLAAFAELEEEHRDVGRILNGLLAFIGFSILAFAIARAYGDYQNLQTLDTLRSLLVVPLLSLLYAPFVYCVALYGEYDSAFVRLTFGEKCPSGKRA